MFNYKNSRLKNIDNPLITIYEYYIDKGGHFYEPSQFVIYFQKYVTQNVQKRNNISFGVDIEYMERLQMTFIDEVNFLISKLDIEHNVTFVEDLKNNKIITIV